ncbi:MAG: C1 family peptidase [Candidatus Nealsonbacteria bacterium]|nr:C1 family peptidase [Candidatus Nealsonbacteria bacterium]
MKRPAKHCLLLVIFLLTGLVSTAIPADNGSLSPEDVAALQESFRMDASTRVIYNAVTNGDVKNLALNRDVVRRNNNHYTDKIKTKGVTNQKSSGRCWLFASLNVLRPAVIEKHNLDGFEFSQCYLAFWDKMEKANCFLEYAIELGDRDPLDREVNLLLAQPFTDGGWWSHTVNLIEKYGVVPKSVMPETNSSESTRSMNHIIGRKLKLDAIKLRGMRVAGAPVEKMRVAKRKMLAEVYRMLVVNLGEPPKEFSWRYVDKDSKLSEAKSYTPQSFYKEWVDVDLRDYFILCNDPSNAYGAHYQVRHSRTFYDRDDPHYVNVTIDVLKRVAIKSLQDNEPVYFGADVGNDQDGEHGIMAMDVYDYGALFGVDIRMNKKQRLLCLEGAPGHAMVLIGVDLKDDKPVKWLVENSWGTSRGDGGFWNLYDSCFDEHVYAVVVKKAYVPKEVLGILDRPVTVLPPWHPMMVLFK